MQAGKLAIHHVGGRWGNVSFSAPPAFERDLVHVIFEADGDAIAAIRAARQKQQAQSIIVHACLAQEAGSASLHITANPGACSLLEPAPPEDGPSANYINLFGIDFDAKGMEVVEKRGVETIALDDLLERREGHPGIPPPDFISLDTQGTEYEILCGARRSLSAVCGVMTEIIFSEMYRGQKRFQEIYDLLDREGFSFVRWSHIHERNGPRSPIGLRAAGCQFFGDALFLRRPWTIEAQSKTQLKKLCFFSIVYGQMEYAVWCLEQLAVDDFVPSSQNTYEAFIADLHQAYARFSKVMPPAFSQVLHSDQFKDFSSATVEEWPKLFDFSAFTQTSYLAELRALQRFENTDIESVLEKHGFDVLAKKVNFNRRHHAFQAEKAISDSMKVRGAGTKPHMA